MRFCGVRNKRVQVLFYFRDPVSRIKSELDPFAFSAFPTLNLHYIESIEASVAVGATVITAPRAVIDPEKLYRLFSSFWHLVAKEKFPQ